MNATAVVDNLKQHFGLDPATSKVLVVGLGITGLSVAYFFQTLEIRFAITDSREKPPLMTEFLQQFPDAALFAGGFDDSAFSVATHLVISPGVALNEKAIVKALAGGAKLISDIDLFACAVDAPVLAITGSNGKSTVTTMVGKMAQAAGKKVAMGGNLGTPALNLLQEGAELYVLELSSFQLERTSVFKALAATVLNLSPDHMDRHPDMDAYAREKARIFQGGGVMVLNADDPRVVAMRDPARTTLTFSIKCPADFHVKRLNGGEYLMQGDNALMPLAELPLEGRHNVANALAALALGFAAGLEASAMCKALKRFKGLAHRMQKVAETKGITWINDSKATNIGACVAALQGYDNKVILIAGGDAKGADMHELVPAVIAKAKHVILMGKDASSIAEALAEQVSVEFAGDMADAVQKAAKIARPGDNVLLSPACASLDQYRNYQERGDKFTKAVLELAL
ncbi:MAG: UDP-N-acetylmuramoyl-L-alanine--D-glutamate ligase [Methylobacter sp.]|nr:MAG: UDP-N-acetylmuramoyl-L-alanine--D-glutamate ligase [Methylobacter sp.]PPD35224.1 MAG: UDP-N-acetylmuramoyl-L-alanine--D-glutamate ligase [Methylomonas sp.]